MNVLLPSAYVGFSVFCVLATCFGVVSCDRHEQLPDGHLVRVAAAAQQQGKSSANVDYFDENAPRASSLAAALKLDWFITAVATATQHVEITPNEIRTWFVFDGVEHVAGARATRPDCRGTRLPPALDLRDGQIAMPLRIGTADIRGVRLTMLGPDSQITIRPGQEYLLVGESCPERVLRPSYGPFSVFYVDTQGGIRPVATSQPTQAAASALGELTTIERLKVAGERDSKNGQ